MNYQDYKEIERKANEIGFSLAKVVNNFCDVLTTTGINQYISKGELLDMLYFDGTKNMITKETYHEVYASQSVDKNNWIREMRKGHSKPLQDELNKSAEKFMNFVKERRPDTPDEWLHGILLECKDTIGIWTNGQATEDDCLQRIINLYNHNH